jgi:hypothetical protein
VQKRSLHRVNEHFKPNLDTVWSSAVFFQQPVKGWVQERFDQLLFHPEMSESGLLDSEPEFIISVITDYFQFTQEQLIISLRGTENLPPDLAISNYSAVSSAIKRMKKRSKRGRVAQNNLIYWEKLLL